LGLVGLAHGLARGAGVLWTLRHRDACELPWEMVLARMRWQTADGAALLLTAAAIVAVYP